MLGQLGWRFFFSSKLEEAGEKVKEVLSQVFKKHKMELFLFLVILFINLYQYGINSMDYMTYLAPDEEVHLYWIQSLVAGNIYPSGVDPHIFHTILAGFIKIFSFDGMAVIIYTGIISTFLIMTTLYLGLRRLFRSKYAALFGFFLYSFADIYLDHATHRFQFSIPQEYGMIFLLPVFWFLIDYIQEKKKSDLVFFTLSLSLTIGSHFYTGVIAVILAISLGLVYFYPIVKEKILFPLLASGILALVIALALLAVGLAQGHELEQSFAWGTEVIQGDIYSDGKEKEEDEKKEAMTLTKVGRDAKKDLEKYLVHRIEYLYFFLLIAFLALLYNLYSYFYQKKDQKSRYQLAFLLNSFLLLFLILFKALGLPTLMEPKRLAIYFAYFSAFLLGMPLELMNQSLAKLENKKIVPVLSFLTIASSFLFIRNYHLVRPLPPLYYLQTTGTSLANWEIMSDYEDDSWTVISPVNNISPIMNRGYHYELDDFILEQEDRDAKNTKEEIKIPTENIFLYVEKRPIIQYGDRFWPGVAELENRPQLKKEDATESLSKRKKDNYHYRNQKERKILMAKAYSWAEEYRKYFPKETAIYYEDDELIVYQIKQNPESPNNLKIDYNFNQKEKEE